MYEALEGGILETWPSEIHPSSPEQCQAAAGSHWQVCVSDISRSAEVPKKTLQGLLLSVHGIELNPRTPASDYR